MTLPTRPRAVVTGAGSGLGRAICLQLARRGARILLADVNVEGAKETAAMLSGAETHVVRCDVTKSDEVRALADEMDSRWGGTDLLVNNAGVAVGGLVGDIALEDWRWIVDVNLWGPVYGCHWFVPRLKKQGSGAILNVASAAGLLSAPSMSAYNVTKAGVIALSETLYGELRDAHISVSVLCPTFFRTNIAVSSRGSDPNMKDFVHKLMARSKVQADDVARIAIDAVDAKRLYVLPHDDGRWFWRLKRAAPQRFYDLAADRFKKMVPKSAR
jgi:NAD(P)-dependent dehydrogenase (short-subunit alcohol dehydrogenase family)